jgi:glycosyltransferase involved in cell wall biosynthesis
MSATISIVVATFNSELTLPLVLQSIRNQSYAIKNIEILIIDGGSKDKTLKIAKKFHCKIVHNAHVEPLYAKYLGYIHAKGRYIAYIDHDEVMMNKNSLKEKLDIFQKHPEVKVVIASGYKSPKGYHVINRYINEFGEPFSFFMYRLSKNPEFFLPTMKKRYPVVRDTNKFTILNLADPARPPLIELTTAASMIDGNFFKATFPEIKKKYHLIPHLLHLLRSSYPYIAILKHDVLIHYSSDNFQKYIQKILWRVKNNIFYVATIGASGFTGRQDFDERSVHFKKYFFILYALTLIFPVIDALYLMISRRDASYIVHIPFTFLTAIFIVYYVLLRFLGMKPLLMSYDGTVQAYEKK